LPLATAGFFWGALPKSGYGKIAKKGLRRLLIDRGDVKGVATR
jgi:fatty-acyl-CoA synthase